MTLTEQGGLEEKTIDFTNFFIFQKKFTFKNFLNFHFPDNFWEKHNNLLEFPKVI